MAPQQASSSLALREDFDASPCIFTLIQSASYFKFHLSGLNYFHEVVDEIEKNVKHLEPWEGVNSKSDVQLSGMCACVRRAVEGGNVSSAYCLLFKLFTLKLTQTQLNILIKHQDSPYIRALGFMYIRYCQPPGELWEWYEPYLDDDEELDVKAGGGQVMTIGQMLREWLAKPEWYSTFFPSIPARIQKEFNAKLRNSLLKSSADSAPQPQRCRGGGQGRNLHRPRSLQEVLPNDYVGSAPQSGGNDALGSSEKDAVHPTKEILNQHKFNRQRSRSRGKDRSRSRPGSRGRDRSRSRSRSRGRDRSRSRSRSRGRDRTRSRSRSRSHGRDRKRSRSRSHGKDRKRSRSKSHGKDRKRSRSRSHCRD